MGLTDIPLFNMLKGKLHYASERQNVIAQNVANADTPEYQPRDLKPFTFDQAMKQAQGAGAGPMAMARTNASHIQMDNVASSAVENQSSMDSEVRLDGNHVVLEEQMMKLTQARMDYDAAVGFYQQSMQLLKTAIKKPGS
jgi:flagellar basal-body rod protein FlgB